VRLYETPNNWADAVRKKRPALRNGAIMLNLAFPPLLANVVRRLPAAPPSLGVFSGGEPPAVACA